MHIRKTVGPRGKYEIKLNGQRRNKAKHLTRNSIRPVCQMLLKALDILNTTAQVASDLQPIAIPSDTRYKVNKT